MARALWAAAALWLAATCEAAANTTLTIVSFSPPTFYPGDAVLVTWASTGPVVLPLTLQCDAIVVCARKSCVPVTWALPTANGSLAITTPLTSPPGAQQFFVSDVGIVSPNYPVQILAPVLTLDTPAPTAFTAGSALSVSFTGNAALLESGVLVQLRQASGPGDFVVCATTSTTSPVVFLANCTVNLVTGVAYTFSVSGAGVKTQTSSTWLASPWPALPSTCPFSQSSALKALIFSTIAYWDIGILQNLSVSVWNDPNQCTLCAQVGKIVTPVASFLNYITLNLTETQYGQVFVTKMADGVVVVSFRGTDSTGGLLADAYIIQTEYAGCASCYIDQGFYRMWVSLAPFVLEQLRALIPASELSSTPVYVTGHSLGGALAIVAGYELKLTGFDVYVTTIASPRCGNTYYAAAWNAVMIGGSTAFAGAFATVPLQGRRAAALDTLAPHRPSAALLLAAERACGGAGSVGCGGFSAAAANALPDDAFWTQWNGRIGGRSLSPPPRARALAGRVEGWYCGMWRVVNYADSVPLVPQPSMGGYTHVAYDVLLTLSPPLTAAEGIAATGRTTGLVATGQLGSGFQYPELEDPTRRAIYVNEGYGDFEVSNPGSYYNSECCCPSTAAPSPSTARVFPSRPMRAPLPHTPSTHMPPPAPADTPWNLTTFSGWIYGQTTISTSANIANLLLWATNNANAGGVRCCVQGQHLLRNYAYRILPQAWISRVGGAGLLSMRIFDDYDLHQCVGIGPSKNSTAYTCYDFGSCAARDVMQRCVQSDSSGCWWDGAACRDPRPAAPSRAPLPRGEASATPAIVAGVVGGGGLLIIAAAVAWWASSNRK